MSLERRLREGMDRVTGEVDPDVDRHLHTSVRSGRRRIVVRRAAAVAGALVVVALVGVAGQRLLDADEAAPRPGGPPSPAEITPASIAGTYTVTVHPIPAVVDGIALAGEWTFELRADGSMSIEAPPGIPVAAEGYGFEIRDGRFETTAFVDDLCSAAQERGRPVGDYTIERAGDDLVLDARDDACAARVEILDDRTLVAAG